MKTISKLALGLVASAVLFSANVSAAKLVSSEVKEVQMLTVSKNVISPYLPLHTFAVTNCYLHAQVFSVGTNTYQVHVHYGQADNYGPPYNTNAPVSITVNGNLTTSYGTQAVQVTVPAGSPEWVSVVFSSSTMPTVQLFTPTNPQTISGIPIQIV